MANNEKCLDPWVGFLIILGVCIVILAGIFHEVRGSSTKHRVAQLKKNMAAQAIAADPAANAADPTGKYAF